LIIIEYVWYPASEKFQWKAHYSLAIFILFTINI